MGGQLAFSRLYPFVPPIRSELFIVCWSKHVYLPFRSDSHIPISPFVITLGAPSE